MPMNVGTLDRAIRIIIGTGGILSLMFNALPQYQTLIGIIGVYFIMTGYLGTCYIYLILKISTRRKEPQIFVLE